MLLEFTLRNFLSFKESATFSMLAAGSVKEHGLTDSDGTCNVMRMPGTETEVLKAAAIYGANGSGKSNLLSAMSFFKRMILDSFRNDSILSQSRKLTFQFSVESQNEPSSFEMTFLVDDRRFRYGFEILDGSVEAEWLFVKPVDSTRESYCFKREGKEITVNSKTFKGARGISGKTRYNALFLSTCAQFNVETAMTVKEWFRKRFNILSGLDDATIHFTAERYLNDPLMRERIIRFIRLVDLGINDISVKESDEAKLPTHLARILSAIPDGSDITEAEKPEIRKIEILSEHRLYDHGILKDTMLTPFGIESLGTKKIFALLGPWFETILNGGTLIIDEFGTSLHTKLSVELLKIFQSSLNREAQLVIATHDTNLLRGELLRRDQIWFTEKDSYGVSDLYSLVEYRINQATSVRNDSIFNKDYLLGKYGAIPYFGNIPQFLSDFSDNSDLSDNGQ